MEIIQIIKKQKNMKKLIFIVAVLISNISLGADVQPLKAEITEKLIIDLSMVELDENHQDFVLVSFYIFNGAIEIAEISVQENLIKKIYKREDYESSSMHKIW
jgi:hypothetical protein